MLFQIAKEHLLSELRAGNSVSDDTKVVANTHTFPGPCPFDIDLIEEPRGALIEVEVNRPMLSTMIES